MDELSFKEKKLKEYEDIYYRYLHLVEFVIAKYINNENDIQDLTNDTFLCFFEHEKMINKDKIQAYLTTTAKNLSINHIEKNRSIQLGELVETLIDEEDQKIISNIRYKEFIEYLLSFLSENEVKIIIYHSVYKYTFYDIGKMFNMSHNTANSIYRRALKKCTNMKGKRI